MTRAALILTLVAAPALADQSCLVSDPDAMQTCLEELASTCFRTPPDGQSALACLTAATAEAESRLDALEADIAQNLAIDLPRIAEKLSANRTAWQAWRDTSCELAAYRDFAAPTGTWQADCALRMTASRWHRLRHPEIDTKVWP